MNAARECGGPGVETEAAAGDRTEQSPKSNAEAQRKRLATVQDQLARRGHELHAVSPAGVFIVRRWGLSRTLQSLDDVETFARQVGAVE